MPIFTNTYPVLNTFTSTNEQFAQGEDYYVTGLQQAMYNVLPAKLGLDANKWNCFGRCFRRPVAVGDNVSGYVPFAYGSDKYIAGGGTSVNSGVFPNDKFVVSFFGEGGSKETVNGFDHAPYELIMFFDTSILTPPFAITPSIRLDEWIIDTVKNFVNLNGNGLHIRGIERDMDDAEKVIDKEIKDIESL